MPLFSIFRVSICRESGTTLLETVVALAILGTIAVVFLGGLVTSSRATLIADERATAESLARSQMEWAKKATYVPGTTSYTAAPIPGGKDYIDYSANITAESLHAGIQKITVSVNRSGEQVFTLEGYKLQR